MGGFNTFQWNTTQWNASQANSGNPACWTLLQIRQSVRRELLDLTGQWWNDTEINQYINDWQNVLQSQFEFVWSRVQLTNALSTITLTTAVATDILRLDAIYFWPGTGTWGTDTSTRRLSPRSKLDLDILQMDWRNVTTNTGNQPEVCYQDDIYTVSFWPPPPGTGTYLFEYPTLLTMTADQQTMQVPCWTRYSALAYCSYRAYGRFGPNQDLRKAQRYKRRFEMQLRKIRKIYDAYMPEKAEMLRPGRKYMGNILIPRANNLQIP